MQLTATLKQFVARARRLFVEDGQDLLEYALLVALIAVVCILAVTFLGKAASSKFSSIGSAVATP